MINNIKAVSKYLLFGISGGLCLKTIYYLYEPLPANYNLK
jgi:hypothetical protein